MWGVHDPILTDIHGKSEMNWTSYSILPDSSHSSKFAFVYSYVYERSET